MNEQHYLTPLFEPRSVAVIGATERERSLGSVVVRNMLEAGFKGKLFAVNPKYEQVFGVPCYRSVEDIPHRLDLAIITTKADRVPAIVDACGRAGTKAVVIITAGFSDAGPRGRMLEKNTYENARRHRIRVLGPNSLGVLRPELGLNASFAHGGAGKGSIGFISQSGALCSAILDWAKPNNVGFSSVISLGTSVDIDFGEVLEYMVSDSRTESIFLYVEGIKDARRFVSALRAAARVKPVLLIKVGRHPVGSRAAQLHSGAMVGEDTVFDAALRRAGVIRLYNLGQLFAAANALFSHFRPRGNHLAIITNGGGPGVMAADRAADLRIPLAKLSDATVAKLNEFLPVNWSHGNPIDIIGDADAERYRKTLEVVLADENVEGVLTMLCPQAMSSATEVAQQVIEIERNADKPLFTCWMGEEQVREGRELFEKAGIPTFGTPEPAVELFGHISAYYRNQKLLVQTPSSLSSDLNPPSVESARLVIETALSERRKNLNEMESKALLAAFRIPIAQTVVARSATEAMVLAEELGLPVAMKIDSPSITHKADTGGVRLNLNGLAAVRSAYQEILEDVKRKRPDATINGVAIEPMIIKPYGRELMVGAVRDPIFGPVITFGEGGAHVEIQADRAVALPPLNNYLVQDLIKSTRIATLLGEYRNMPPINMESLEFVLLRISEMVCELPWIREIDINPLIVDENGAVAVDARITVDNIAPTADRYDHMAIHPYPSHLITKLSMPEGEITVRPIKPEDAELEIEFVRKLSPETKYLRFMNTMRELPPAMVARLTQIDYDREMAFVATMPDEKGDEVEIGVCRYAVNPDGETCEFAIVVAEDWQHRGLARRLMGVLIETARNRGLQAMTGIFLSNNDRMLKFVSSLGFVLTNDPEDNTIKHGVLPLQG